MSSNVFDLTKIEPKIVITETEYVELNKLKTLLAALNIKNVDDLSIGQIIRLRRVNDGLTIKELADATGTDRGHLTKLELNETNVRFTTIEKLDAAFGKDFSRAISEIQKLTK